MLNALNAFILAALAALVVTLGGCTDQPPGGFEETPSPSADVDGDGSYAPADCNDADANVHPDAPEVCDNVDNNCDGITDEGTSCYDDDGDGYSETQNDCNDSDPAVHPGATEACDGIDSNCDGIIDGTVTLNGQCYTRIQAAVDDATVGATVWVGPGTYFEYNITFRGKAVSLVSTAGSSKTVIDAQQMGSVMVFNFGEGPETVVEGFTLTGGSGTSEKICGNDPASETPDINGGAICIQGASPTIRDSIVHNNSVFDGAGGGVYLVRSAATFENVVISGNVADVATFGAGGGFYASDSTPTLTNVAVLNNTTATGGGMVFIGGDAHLDHVAVLNNQAGYIAGGIFAYNCRINISQSAIVGNTSDWQVGGLTISYATMEIKNSIVAYNSSAQEVGDNFLNEVASGSSSYTAWWTPAGDAGVWTVYPEVEPGAWAPGPTDLVVEPGFLAYANGLPTNLHLALTSPLVNAGNPTESDIDGSRLNLGIYGGVDGGLWDLDDDGYFDYPWPGSFADAPVGIDTGVYDPNDGDANIPY